MATHSGIGIDRATIEEYRRDGVTCVRGVIGDEWIERMRGAVEHAISADRFASQVVSLKDQGFTGDLFMWREDADFRSLVFDSPLAGIARQFLESESVRIFYDQLFVKEPGSRVPTAWHHDLTYWGIDGTQICSIWMPLDPVTVESSALEYVRGSHRWPNRYKATTLNQNPAMVNPDLEDPPDIDHHRDDYDLVSYEMEPGDITVLHPLVVHGSSGNRSLTTRRRAISTRWAGDDVTYDPRPATFPLPADHGLEAGQPLGGPVFPTVIG